MEESSNEAIFDSLNLNPQLFINEAFNTVDELFDEAFNYFHEEASVRLKTQGTDRHEELNEAVSHIKKLIHSNLDQLLQQWEEYCLRYSFRIPEGFSLPKAHEPSGLSAFDGLADTHHDAELNSLREKLTLVEKESADISKEIHTLERQTLSSNQSARSIEEVVQLYNKNNNTQLFQEMVTMASQFRAKVGNLKRKLAEETDCSKTDKIRVTDGNLLRMNRSGLFGATVEELEEFLDNITKSN